MFGRKAEKIRDLTSSLKYSNESRDDVIKERNKIYDTIYEYLQVKGLPCTINSFLQHVSELIVQKERNARQAEVENIVLELLKREKLIKAK